MPMPPTPFAPRSQAGLSRPRLLAGLAALAVAAGLGAWWWQGRAPAAGEGGDAASAASRRFGGPAGSRPQPVSVGQARQQDIRVVVNAIGTLTALNTAVVRARVDGELKALRFKEGQQVRAGQLLAEIDPRAFQVALAQAEGQLARDQAQLKNAQLDLTRYQDLLAKDSIARQQVDTQDALVRQLQGTVKADQAAVDSARLQLSYTQVLAPIGGRLGLKQADLGNVVRASDTNGIVSITQTQPIAVVFAVPETHLAQINRQLKANQPLPVEAWDREQRQRLASGRVTSTDNAIDSATGTIRLKAEFANADGALFANQFANIRLQIDQLSGVLAVPVPAVQRGTPGTFVYAVQDDGAVQVRRVRLGATDGDWVQVEGELAAGERVVTDGADRLRDGAKVEVITPGGARNGAGAPTRRHAASSPASAASGPATGRVVGELPPAAPTSAAVRGPGAASAAAPLAGAADATASAAVGAAAAERPAWLDRLPPEVREKLQAMPPEERRAYLRALRERRQREAP